MQFCKMLLQGKRMLMFLSNDYKGAWIKKNALINHLKINRQPKFIHSI